MKKFFVILVAVMMLFMVGCGGSSGGKTLDVKFSNASSYMFNEIYITPSAANEWGDDLLGSTSVLKTNGSVDVQVAAYDFDTYDIRVIDEDGDYYEFTRVSLSDGGEVAIYFGDEGLAADVSDGAGDFVSTYFGSLNGESTGGGGSGGEESTEPAEGAPTGGGYNTDGYFEFTIYNESDYEIYEVYIGNNGVEEDVLPTTLAPGASYTVSETLDEQFWNATDWSFYVTDVEGDDSYELQWFDLWSVSYVDIYWSSDVSGYVADFIY